MTNIFNIIKKIADWRAPICVVFLFCVVLQPIKCAANTMALKYQHEIEGLNIKDLCPTETIQPLGVEVYRWSCEPIEHPNNFLPNVAFDRAINNPYPYHKKEDSIKCRRCASSFFTNIQGALNRWEHLSEQNKENFGYTHIAAGVLDNNDGEMHRPDESSGHFGFYEYDNVDLTKKFVNILELKNVRG